MKHTMSKRILTEEEIIRWLRRFQMDPEFRANNVPNGTKTVPLSCFARYAGVRRATLYELLRRRRPFTLRMRERLTFAIQSVQSGLRWQKQFQGPTVMVGEGVFQEFPRFGSGSTEHQR